MGETITPIHKWDKYINIYFLEKGRHKQLTSESQKEKYKLK